MQTEILNRELPKSRAHSGGLNCDINLGVNGLNIGGLKFRSKTMNKIYLFFLMVFAVLCLTN